MMRWLQTSNPEDFKMGETVNLTGDSDRKICPLPGCGRRGFRKYSSSPGRKDYLTEAFIQKAKESQAADKTTITRLVDGIQKLAIAQHGKGPVHGHGLAL
ncbi:MAG: hypothetical protein ACLR8P_14625 [Clostridium fessum]